MASKKIALIGGAGFIGHNLAMALKREGHEPFIVDGLAVNNFLSFADSKVKNHKFYRAILNKRIDLMYENEIEINVQDARNYEALCLVLHKANPDVIIQLAAVSHANLSNKNPHATFDHSLRTLENALDFSKPEKSSVQHFIYFSSSMVYGHFEGKDVTEETECKPIGIYGTLKYSGELMVKVYNQVFELPYTIIRPSALYGKRCVSRRAGQIFIENAVEGQDITIHGDGSDRLDFTYIDDLVQGIIKVIENENARNQIFNMTYGESRTIGELAKILKDHFSGIEIHYKSKDKLTPDRGTLRVDKAKDLIGYDPRNPIEEGYPKYIQWYKEIWKELT